jgi:hypothetical protein
MFVVDDAKSTFFFLYDRRSTSSKKDGKSNKKKKNRLPVYNRQPGARRLAEAVSIFLITGRRLRLAVLANNN